MRRNTFAADDAANGGANRADIEQAFVGKKIGGPLEPTSLSLIGDPNSGDVDLSWNDESSLEDGYDVEMRLNGGAWSTIANLASNATSYTDEYIFCKSGDNDYDYRVRVYEGSLESYSPTRSYNPCWPPMKGGIAQTPTGGETPTAVTLSPAYPNPFNPSTVLEYTLDREANVRISAFDALGREVRVLVDGERGAGQYTAGFDASGLPSGVYFVRLVTEHGIVLRTSVLYSK